MLSPSFDKLQSGIFHVSIFAMPGGKLGPGSLVCCMWDLATIRVVRKV